MIGPDGKVYPGWDPPVVTDPATGTPCTFGHEHGRDPRGSDLYAWVAAHPAAPGRENYAGIPFGAATEALESYADANPGTARRQEDRVGYKVEYENDVPLTTANGYPSGAGTRLIPDRACMESGFLVPSGRTTTVWAAYELWSADNELKGGNQVLAAYDTAFGVFDPSRYAEPARTLALCWEVEPSGDRANGPDCDAATAFGTPFAFDDVRSPYDGTHRDVYLRDTTLANAGGPPLWWTDPYGETRHRGRSRARSASSSAPSIHRAARPCSSAWSGATAATTHRACTLRTE